MTRLKTVVVGRTLEDCVFCQIIKGKAPASIVYSDEQVLCLMDIRPVNPGHVLVVPKAHVPRLADLDDETGGHVFRIAIRIAKALAGSGLRCEGINLFLADGNIAGQEIFHVHVHVIPRFEGDGFGIKFGPHYGVQTRKELDAAASKIRDTLR